MNGVRMSFMRLFESPGESPYSASITQDVAM